MRFSDRYSGPLNLSQMYYKTESFRVYMRLPKNHRYQYCCFIFLGGCSLCLIFSCFEDRDILFSGLCVVYV